MESMIFSRSRNSGRKISHAPGGVRLYAIGDIHGRLDLLESLLELIELDQKKRREAPVLLIFLGDYIDRGPDSKGVVDRIIQGFAPPYSVITLKGNHEKLLLSFLGDPSTGANWLRNGGEAALTSYGADFEAPPGAFWDDEDALKEAAELFRAALPENHLRFYEELKLSWRAGDYFFAHAGVRPDERLDRQTEDDLLWIRNEFLNSKDDFGAVVVHGHTPARFPQNLPNRIGVDTFAVRSGMLTAVGLEGAERWFLTT
jgi:serine/threonine protein phosphatase 1